MKKLRCSFLAVRVSFAMVLWSGSAIATGPEFEAEHGEGSPVPKVGITMLGGLVVPLCWSQQGCDGNLGAGPSIEGLVLYAPNDSWAVGVAVQMSRVHWREPYIGMSDGRTYQIDSDLTAGFAAVAARYTPLTEHRVTPVAQAAIGAGLQTQTGTNSHCNDGFIPTGQLAVGVRAQASPNFSFFGLASASLGLKLSDCGVSDGPGTTPFAGWGFGLHLGAAFDVVL